MSKPNIYFERTGITIVEEDKKITLKMDEDLTDRIENVCMIGHARENEELLIVIESKRRSIFRKIGDFFGV